MNICSFFIYNFEKIHIFRYYNKRKIFRWTIIWNFIYILTYMLFLSIFIKSQQYFPLNFPLYKPEFFSPLGLEGLWCLQTSGVPMRLLRRRISLGKSDPLGDRRIILIFVLEKRSWLCRSRIYPMAVNIYQLNMIKIVTEDFAKIM